MKRSQPLRRTPMPSRVTPFPRAPWKRTRRSTTASDATLKARRPIVLQDPCRLCKDHSEVVHHRKLRSQGGDHSWSNLLPLCHWCHDACHRYVAYATAIGFLVLRHEDPRLIPVLELSTLPTAARLRLTKPLFDHRALGPFIEAEHAKLGPEWA